MAIRKTKAVAASLIAATGLASLSPVQQAALSVAAVGALGKASPAWASVNLPGVGLVVKKKPGNSPIVVPSDANGNSVLTGLEPGEYDVKLIGAEQSITVPVGRDGRLAITAWEDKGRQWVAPLRLTAAAPVRTTSINLPRTFSVTPPTPCARPVPGKARNPACRGSTMNYIDVNTSTAEDIVRLAPATSLEAARVIVEQRTNEAFTNAMDFANRVCPRAAIDFGHAPTRIGDTSIIAAADIPRVTGWKCAPGKPVIELYGKRYNYVGHVTLLR